MRTLLSPLAALFTWLALVALALAQNSPSLLPAPSPDPNAAGTLVWQTTPRDGLSTTWDASEQATNAATGAIATRHHRFVEVASGLNYLDPATGQFQPSQDLIELTADGGAAAVHGPAKLYAHPNLNTAGAITIVTVSNRVFRTRPLGLFFYDAQSGHAQLIAPVQDCVGEFVPPNQLVWKSAFGPLADLRLTYTKSAIESDVVVRQQPTLPDGWDPQTTRLEVWHAQTAFPPPRLTPRLLYGETNATLRGQMLEPDLTDQMLDFGDLWFPTGAAYGTDGSDAPAPGTARTIQVLNVADTPGLIPVAKTWLTAPSGSVLVEAVRWPDIQPQIEGLPGATQPVAPATSPVPFAQDNRLACLNQLAAPRSASQPGLAIKIAPDGYHPGACVLDYITVPSSYSSPYSFAGYSGANTYYVSGTTYFGATVTFNPGCIIKLNPGAYLLIYGAIVCNGTTANPSVLTAWNDDLFGENLPNSLGCPTYAASSGLWDYYINANLTLSGLRIRWAQTGVRFDANGCGQYTHTLANSSLEFCQTGIYEDNGNLVINNSKRCAVGTPVSNNYTCTSVTGSLTDIGSGDADGNGLADSLDYQYFGRLSTLPGYEVGRLTAHVSGHNASTDQVIWSVRDDANTNYVYNSGCWLYGVQGLTAFSPWHTPWWNGTFTVANNLYGGTLITPRHAVTAGHTAFPDGLHVRFAGTDKTYEVVCLHSALTTVIPDLSIMVFDRDLPTGTVGFVPVVPTSVAHKLTPAMETSYDQTCPSGTIPLVSCNQQKEAYISDAWDWQTAVSDRHSLWFPNWGSWCYRNGPICTCYPTDVTDGDSGSPNFLLFYNQLVLVGPWGTCNTATMVGVNTNDVNNVITALDTWVSNTYQTNAMTGYKVSVFDLSPFPDLR
jgi:hypothetical protein